MASSWHSETGNLSCRWSKVGQDVPYAPFWMQQTSAIPCGYLPQIADFAAHSPFGGATWFEPGSTKRNSD